MPSSVIDSMEYLPKEHVLRVTFLSGSVYDYHDVPESTFGRMRRARSKGTFLNKYIKGHFDFTKVA